MPGKRLTALLLAAFSITALRAQDKIATSNPSSSDPSLTFAGRRPVLDTRIAASQTTIPPVMHLCIARCFPIMWDQDHYINFGPENTSIYTVESFTRDSIVMHRTDKGHFPLTADITGRMSEDGNSIVNGRIVWTSGNSGSGPFNAKWGSAIEDDQVLGQRRLLHIPCDASSRVSIAEASERAEQLLEANNLTTAICWMRIGATQGDAEAQGALASIFYRGVGVPVNIHEAALWAEKASAQGNYLGEHVLSNMYAKGDAEPKDAAKAEYWRAKYEKDKLARDRAEEEAKEAGRQRAQAQAQQNQEATELILRILIGAFSADSESPRKSAMVCSAAYAAVCAQTH